MYIHHEQKRSTTFHNLLCRVCPICILLNTPPSNLASFTRQQEEEEIKKKIKIRESEKIRN
jgi:hypothetical protein